MANEIYIRGTLGADAELRYTKTGRALLALRIADSKSKRNDSGGWDKVRPTIWHNGTVWGRFAETLANGGALTKGTQVEATGELSVREYEHNGEKRWSSEVTIRQIGIIEPRNNSGGGQQNSFAQTAPVNDPWSTDAQGSTWFESEPPF